MRVGVRRSAYFVKRISYLVAHLLPSPPNKPADKPSPSEGEGRVRVKYEMRDTNDEIRII